MTVLQVAIIFIPKSLPSLILQVNKRTVFIGPNLVDSKPWYLNSLVVVSSRFVPIFDLMIVLGCWWNRISCWGFILLTAESIQLEVTNKTFYINYVTLIIERAKLSTMRPNTCNNLIDYRNPAFLNNFNFTRINCVNHKFDFSNY